jgi:hypothetical protein
VSTEFSPRPHGILALFESLGVLSLHSGVVEDRKGGGALIGGREYGPWPSSQSWQSVGFDYTYIQEISSRLGDLTDNRCAHEGEVCVSSLRFYPTWCLESIPGCD